MALDALLGQAEVRDLQVALVVQDDVLRLQVTVNDSILMKAFKGTNELGSIEACPGLGEALLLSQMIEELPSIEEVHNEIELLGGLERVVQLHDEG